ncbi:DUF1570 domain-containing protein [Paludisphaera mucosa]|uniref:DUF1570 domain-containing protein n=1 Tax=Paludisphaera mucosa TaxID=3030827 RepID=A0ABT6FGJ2_9BACT|nr:DUF1570 domain-containing protein [Paludisphaera mucosa]MDG3006662.1 DUF1570 domain-containing protein [Paludisphaera mucosa]
MRIDSIVDGLDRRRWLRATAAGLLAAHPAFAGFQDAAKPEPGPPRIQDADPEEVARKLREVGLGEPRRLKSNHFLAIGDAAESFMRSCLTDCEHLLLAYLRHFQDRGFDVREPDRPLIVVAFRDDRSFGKYHRMPSLMSGGAQPVGMYDKATNLLSVFDWRNVPMASRAAVKNVQTVSHEGTHQLTFNTGLLDRASDVSPGIVEGLGTYGEPRKVIGPSDVGRLNLQRLDDLAKLRRSVAWIPVRDLIADDAVLRSGLYSRVMLGYAESWALVHYLLNDKDRLPGFRDYLKALRSRTKPGHRLDDARETLGDLDELDRDLQAYAVRLVRSL